MDQSRAPLLDALVRFRERGDVVFGPPGHKQGRGADPRAVEVLGAGVYESDGVAAGMVVPDTADPSAKSLRVVAR
ncbi:MAG: arginine decarboxylase [Mycobacteriales bacterium]|jgi:arginine/lysine/ornithine decarboxylase